MAVFQQHDSNGHRFVARPNCALSWRSTKQVILFFACCLAAVGYYFASMGAWLVLPFAGLEFAVLGLGLYLNALSGRTLEVVEIKGRDLRVLRGRGRLKEVVRFSRHWTEISLIRDPRGWYPSRLLLRCHGRRIEVGGKLVEAEREELAVELHASLGFLETRRGRPLAEPLASRLASHARRTEAES